MENRGYLTKRKLEEAKFFFDQLESNYGKLNKFAFVLSAFVSSARSVLWVMRSEYESVSGWKSWYESLNPDHDEALLLKGTNDVRTRTAKRGLKQTASTFTVRGIEAPKEEAEAFEELMSKIHGKKIPMKLRGTPNNITFEMEIDGERKVFSAADVIIERKLDEFPDRNIVEVCEKYYGAVAKVVEQCSRKFDA